MKPLPAPKILLPTDVELPNDPRVLVRVAPPSRIPGFNKHPQECSHLTKAFGGGTRWWCRDCGITL
jgi:hypothetical protein